ncbi:insulin receptor substrate 2 isoform X2 [Zootoca vivipara]|uniref:insulin receptor substrate 2 isoform X2 n=1 Tax=Zootoca vivipara TaxID=8524 RepID=UPI00293C113D|nr:insulin receptor substrate 2 isoform X2 [Zootoca vivipara]
MASPPAAEPPDRPRGSLNRNNNNNNQPPPPLGVRKCGYLRKHKHGHRRFFVLCAASDGAAADEAPPQPARLEYYESEKKWRSKAAAPRRSIALDSSLTIHKRADAKHKHLVALYTRDEYFALAAESEPEQEAWYAALTELLRRSQPAAGPGSPGREEPPPPPGAWAYREVWQVTLKGRGLGQSRHLAGVHRLCLAARAVGLVRLNCQRPCVTLQLMTIRRCGHSDSCFFLELGRSASTGPGELWMQADDAVVAQNIHETILEAMKALRELAEFRPRSKSQSSSSSSSSSSSNSSPSGAGASGALTAMCSRPISVPGRRRRRPHQPPSRTALSPSQAGLLRRSRTDTLGAGRSSGNRSRTASEGDGGRAGSPSGPEAGEPLLGRSHTPGAACCRLARSLALVHSPSLVTKPGMFSQRRPSSSSSSTSGSPCDPASFLAFEELGPASNHSNTPETPPGLQLDGYIAMERGHLFYWPYIWESAGGGKVPRKRTYSLTTPASRHPMPTLLSSASLGEYILMRATLPTAGASSRGTYTPYPEDYCDVDIGSGGTSSSSSSSLLGHSGSGEEGYMPMRSGAAAVMPLQGGPGGYMSMKSVSAPQQILHPHSHKFSSDNSLDDSDYMRMLGTRWSGESPDGRITSGDYTEMSPLLLPPVHGSASPVPSPDGFAGQGPRDQTSNFYNPLSHACQRQPNSLGEKKNSDQYVFMNSPVERLTLTPKGESFLAICNHTMMPSPIYYSQTECSLTPYMNEQPPTNEPQSPHKEYVNIGYSLAYGSSASSLGSGLNDSLIPSYMNFDGSQSAAVETLEDVLMPGSCPSPGQPDKHYLKVEMKTTFTTATPTQPILQKPENIHESSPVTELKQLTLSEVQAFIFASPPPDPNHGAKVIRANPQGRWRHNSETFSSTTTVTPVSPSFAHSPKRHNSASVENVSLRKNGLLEEQTSSTMCRETSAGFQNGLNHIAVDVLEEDYLASGGQGKHKGRHPCNESINGTYTSIDFLTHNLKEASSVKGDWTRCLIHLEDEDEVAKAARRALSHLAPQVRWWAHPNKFSLHFALHQAAKHLVRSLCFVGSFAQGCLCGWQALLPRSQASLMPLLLLSLPAEQDLQQGPSECCLDMYEAVCQQAASSLQGGSSASGQA